MSKPVPALNDLTDAVPGGIADALHRGLRAVSSQTGLIKRLYFETLYPDDPAFYWAMSEPGDLTPLLGRAVPNRGTATAASPERAAMKALGESLERYCAAFYNPDELILAPSDGLPGRAVDVRKFALFDAAQYASSLPPIDSPDEAGNDALTSSKRFHFSRVDHDVSLRWTKARSLVTGDVVFVPAAFVYIPYTYDYPAEPIVADLVSTGLACGSTLAEACYKGLMEVMERDAFMLTWHHRIPAQTIHLDVIGNLTTRDLLTRFNRLPIMVEAYLISVDIEIPVVLVVISGDQRPFHVVGAAADLSAYRALQLALEEAALSFCGLRRLCQQQTAWPSDADFSDVDDLTKHAVVHATSENSERAWISCAEARRLFLRSTLLCDLLGATICRLRWE